MVTCIKLGVSKKSRALNIDPKPKYLAHILVMVTCIRWGVSKHQRPTTLFGTYPCYGNFYSKNQGPLDPKPRLVDT